MPVARILIVPVGVITTVSVLGLHGQLFMAIVLLLCLLAATTAILRTAPSRTTDRAVR